MNCDREADLFRNKKETTMKRRQFIISGVLGVLALAASPPVWSADTHQGKVVEVGPGKLTMTDTAGKNQHTHEVVADAAITCEGKTCGLTDVKAGDMVTVTTDMKDGKTVATKIEAKKAGS
jgi:hypothetical protein